MPVFITYEQPAHASAIESLNDASFGLGRHTKTVAKLRDGVAPVQALCLVAIERETGELAGSIRYWPIALGKEKTPALMLGPIVAAEGWQGQKLDSLGGNTVATALILNSLHLAKELGHDAIILKCSDTGLIPYYEKLGFSTQCVSGLSLPGANSVQESNLLMGLGNLAGVSGMVAKYQSPHLFHHVPPCNTRLKAAMSFA